MLDISFLALHKMWICLSQNNVSSVLLTYHNQIPLDNGIFLSIIDVPDFFSKNKVEHLVPKLFEVYMRLGTEFAEFETHCSCINIKNKEYPILEPFILNRKEINNFIQKASLVNIALSKNETNLLNIYNKIKNGEELLGTEKIKPEHLIKSTIMSENIKILSKQKKELLIKYFYELSDVIWNNKKHKVLDFFVENKLIQFEQYCVEMRKDLAGLKSYEYFNNFIINHEKILLNKAIGKTKNIMPNKKRNKI